MINIFVSHVIMKIVLIITKTRPCNILQFFMAVKDNFQLKNCDFFFLFFAQIIDCGYTLEPPQ